MQGMWIVEYVAEWVDVGNSCMVKWLRCQNCGPVNGVSCHNSMYLRAILQQCPLAVWFHHSLGATPPLHPPLLEGVGEFPQPVQLEVLGEICHRSYQDAAGDPGSPTPQTGTVVLGLNPPPPGESLIASSSSAQEWSLLHCMLGFGTCFCLELLLSFSWKYDLWSIVFLFILFLQS